MAVYALSDAIAFPPVHHAEPDGFLAVGGDLSPERLLTAYSQGIFPWYSEGEPILWFCTRPRPILPPSELVVPKSLRPLLRDPRWSFSVDKAFDHVIAACSTTPRPGQSGTWILPEMVEAYTRLHALGFAHSVEVWKDGELAGGLYGVSLGRTFYGESMFMHVPNASKYGFVRFVRGLEKLGFDLIDCQQTTDHLLRFGAYEVPLPDFLNRLQRSLQQPTIRGKWTDLDAFASSDGPAPR